MRVAVINQSPSTDDSSLALTVAACQRQLTEHVLPWWQGEPFILEHVARGEALNPSTEPFYKCILTDDPSSVPNALGYHTDEDGSVTAYVFPRLDAEYGSALSVTLSHELIEMFGDPTASATISIDGLLYIRELCDAVEADEDGYEIDGVRVSNFVTPLYFNLPSPLGALPTAQAVAVYDFCQLLHAPCPSLRPGGYMDFYSDSSWQTLTARLADGSHSARSRRQDSRRRFRVAHSL